MQICQDLGTQGSRLAKLLFRLVYILSFPDGEELFFIYSFFSYLSQAELLLQSNA